MADIERELRLLQRFTHDHLVRVHRIVDTDQGPGMLMDLAAGGSLLGLVTSRGPLPIAEVVTALAPVAQALGHLHAAGALHGDVTPGNILFTQEGKPLLGDFGTGRLLGTDGVASTGTPGFIDPLRNTSFDAATDVFALAAVCWFALTGRIPGPAKHRPPLVLIVPDVPPILMQLIEDGLSSSRERRPNADGFARTLLSSWTPGPVNLVPAVHPSVLPELLTRRAESRALPPLQGWRRIAGWRSRRGDRLPGRSRGGRASDVQPSIHRRGTRGTPAAVRDGPRGLDGRRTRDRLAVAAGLAAAMLLVLGVALAVGGLPAPVGPPSGQASERGQAVDGEAGREVDQEGDDGPGHAAGQGTGRDIENGPDQQAGPTRSAGQAPSTEASPEADPAAALGTLAALRATAFATADPALLAAVDVEGSPAMAVDREAVTALADSGRTMRDLSITIRDPSVLDEEDLQATPALAGLPSVDRPPAATEVSVVRATARLSSYTETAASPRADSAPGPASGSVPGSVPQEATSPLMAAGQQELIFILWNSGQGWRIHSVVSPPG